MERPRNRSKTASLHALNILPLDYQYSYFLNVSKLKGNSKKNKMAAIFNHTGRLPRSTP